MKSITLHKIDDPLLALIKSRARSDGLSINKTVKKILEESLGVKPVAEGAFRNDFKEFCGIWADTDIAEFDEKTKDLRKIDPEDWR